VFYVCHVPRTHCIKVVWFLSYSVLNGHCSAYILFLVHYMEHVHDGFILYLYEFCTDCWKTE
jgi:hypothetical protein